MQWSRNNFASSNLTAKTEVDSNLHCIGDGFVWMFFFSFSFILETTIDQLNKLCLKSQDHCEWTMHRNPHNAYNTSRQLSSGIHSIIFKWPLLLFKLKWRRKFIGNGQTRNINSSSYRPKLDGIWNIYDKCEHNKIEIRTSSK